MLLIVVTVLTVLVSLLASWHIRVRYGRVGKFLDKLPGPPLSPIFGNLLQFHLPLVEINNLLRDCSKKYYPVYKLWFANIPIINIQHPDDLQILLTSPKNINKHFAYEHFYPWLKTGLLTSSDKKWHNRRKILTPAFHFNILEKYMEITDEQGDQAIINTKAEGKESIQELLTFCSRYTLNIICESAMGVALDSKEHMDTAVEYKKAVYRVGNIIIYRLIRPYVQEWMVPFMPRFNRNNKEVLKILNDFTDKIVKERREYHKTTNYKNLKELQDEPLAPENVYIGKKKRLAMLDLLLAAEKDGLIDDEGIKEEVATFIFEGHDTTAMALCFAIMLLAENQAAQDKAREEVEGMLEAKGGKLEINDLPKMHYLDRCLKEVVRLYPSVPMVARTLTEDIQLKNCFAPKGANILVHFIDTFRLREFWVDPEKFDPDRFLPDRFKTVHPFAYVPFSAGPRNCIGQKFALMELKSIIAKILYNFRLEPIDYLADIKIQSDVVIRPSHPVHTKFIRIDR